MALGKFFYTRLVYSSTTIDFTDPTAAVEIAETPIVGRNISVGGVAETLWERNEVRLTLRFIRLSTAELTALYTFWQTHASKGRQAAITLDRLSTCAGQWEYDTYNTYFTKAELLNDPFAPGRSVLQRALYQTVLLFRQGI